MEQKGIEPLAARLGVLRRYQTCPREEHHQSPDQSKYLARVPTGSGFAFLASAPVVSCAGLTEALYHLLMGSFLLKVMS